MPKISQYPSMTALTGAEIFVGDQAGVTSTGSGVQIAALAQGGLAAVDSGAVNAYVLTTSQAFTSNFVQGQIVSFFPLHPNTGASTADVNGKGVVEVIDSAGNALTGGELIGPVLLVWTGAKWELLWTLPLVNKRTAAEIGAGVTPVNYAYAPGNVLRYGADPTGTNDSTTAIQAAINQLHSASTISNVGAAVYLPAGSYKVGTGHNTTAPVLTGYAGTKITGDGWASNAGTFAPQSGTSISYVGTGAAPVLSIQGISTGNYDETVTLRDFAVYNNSGTANCIGIQLLFAPFSILQNIYVATFTGPTGYGIEHGNSSYQCCFINVKIENCGVCQYSHDAGEDSTWISCLYRTFNYTSGIGLLIKDQCQTSSLIGVDLSDNLYGLFIEQGDSNGNGTGLPLPMQISLMTCQFENCTNAAIAVTTSSQSQATQYYPSLFVQNCRFYVPSSGGPITPNNGQAILYAQCLSQAKIEGLNESGYSYGAILGASQYGQTFSGTAKMGPVVWGLDTGYTYGTSRFLTTGGASIRSVCLTTGDHSVIRMNATALSYTTPTSVPFTVVSSDAWGWYNSSLTAIQPTKNQTTRFKTQVYTDVAAVGRYQLTGFKNGSAQKVIYDQTVSTAGNPLMMTGEWFDVPSGPGDGTGDYYTVVITAAPNFTLDTSQSYFMAEVMGE